MGKYKIRMIICSGCGKTITKRLRPNQQYCSVECYRKSSKPQRKNGKEIVCMWCFKKIYKSKCFLEKSKYHFCSIECQIEWQSRNKIKYQCETCKKWFKISKSLMNSSNRRFCSIECRDNGDWDGNIKGGIASVQKQQKKKGYNNLEKKGYKLLKELNLDFDPQVLINDKFLVDALINENIVIEWDGDYWHGHPSLKPFNKHQILQKKKDNTKNQYLKKCGYKILRFWEQDIYNHPDLIKEKIIEVI